MREAYREDLSSVVEYLVLMTERVVTAVQLSTRALLEADLALAEQVITDDAVLDAQHDDLEARCFVLLARQAPVASSTNVASRYRRRRSPHWWRRANWPASRAPASSTI